ncbi:protein transporter Sec31 [Streptomyces sp. NPDC056987]|uniref:protein transporter Sec31 n=1 Tax=Streptomyces sp. NPDC056987 TaxID=3345988 RepID=UPI00364543E4
MTSKDIVSGPSVRTGGQRLPGIRYETQTRTRLVPHTEDGETEMIEQPYQVDVPVEPRDWDRTVLTAVTRAALGLLAVAVVWSVASIGDLLDRAVPAGVAYLGGGAFVTVWICCMALEWLFRYNQDRAQTARTAGTTALVLDMAAVCIHGWLEASVWVGVTGAAISAAAKGLWTVVMKSQSRPLSPETQQWLRKREARISARLALAAQLRNLARIEAQAAVYAPLPTPDTRADNGPDTDTVSGHDVRAVRVAVRAASAAMPDATPEDIAGQLATAGVPVDEDTVRVLLDADTDSADTTDSRSQPRVRPIAPRGQSVTDTVRTAMSSGMTDPDKVLSYVRGLHGQDVSTSTVARIRRRVETEMAS